MLTPVSGESRGKKIPTRQPGPRRGRFPERVLEMSSGFRQRNMLLPQADPANSKTRAGWLQQRPQQVRKFGKRADFNFRLRTVYQFVVVT